MLTDGNASVSDRILEAPRTFVATKSGPSW